MITLGEVKTIWEECLIKGNEVTSEDILAVKFVFETQNLEINMLEQYIQTNFEYILSCSRNVSEVVNELMKIGNMKEFIKNYLNDNFGSFSFAVPKEIIFEEISKYVSKNRILLNEFLKNNKSDYVKYLLTSMISDNQDDELEAINEVVLMIVDEILVHEKKDYVDIEKLKSGAYSKVIQIGSKVIKVGTKRETYQIPNTSVLLQPLIRKDLSLFSSLDGTIEVMEKVETKVHLSDEQLYQVYKIARDEGIVLADLKADNVGILLNDNVLHWSKSMSDNMETRGISGDVKEVVKTGDMVLIDSDLIYKEADYLEKMAKLNLKKNSEFENRYILEQSQKDLNEDRNASQMKK